MNAMKNVGLAACLVVLALGTGCSGSTDGAGGSEVMGSSGTGGTGAGGMGFVPIGTGGGGMSGGGAGGASSTVGGTGSGGTGDVSNGGMGAVGNSGGGQVGSAGAGPQGVPGYPTGPVILCFGDGCPMGECDNDMFFADAACSTVYPSDIGPSSTYCKPAESSSYCLEIGPDFGPDFSVSCASGKATVLKCNGGCGSEGGGPYQCSTF
jgi:hypothetical protein